MNELIKIKAVGKQANNAVLTIEFDDFDGSIREVTKSLPAQQLLGNNLETLRTYVLNRVEAARTQKIENELTAKLASVLDVDIEEGLPTKPAREPSETPEIGDST